MKPNFINTDKTYKTKGYNFMNNYQIDELMERLSQLERKLAEEGNASITYRQYNWTDKIKALAFPALFALVVFFFSVTYNQLQRGIVNQEDIKIQLMVQGEKFNSVQKSMSDQSKSIDDLNERMKAVERAINR